MTLSREKLYLALLTHMVNQPGCSEDKNQSKYRLILKSVLFFFHPLKPRTGMYSSTKGESKHTEPKHFLGCCLTVLPRLFAFNHTQSKGSLQLQLKQLQCTLHTPWNTTFVIGTMIIFPVFISAFACGKTSTVENRHLSPPSSVCSGYVVKWIFSLAI